MSNVPGVLPGGGGGGGGPKLASSNYFSLVPSRERQSEAIRERDMRGYHNHLFQSNSFTLMGTREKELELCNFRSSSEGPVQQAYTV